jgi:Protein of unknown function (DUF4446)
MTSPHGLYDWLALAAAAGALISAALLTWNALALRRLRRAQKVVLGDGERDIVAHAADLQREFVTLRDWIDETGNAIDRRMVQAEARLDGAVSHTAMLRYDAYGELTGHQSSSVALVDDRGTGVIISAIRHRSHSHLYVKELRGGESDIELSPEEREVLQRARAGNLAPNQRAAESSPPDSLPAQKTA